MRRAAPFLLTLLAPLAAALPNPLSPSPPSALCSAPGYLPPDAAPSRAPLALVDIYTSPNCTADANASGSADAYTRCRLPIYESGKCVPFMAHTQTLHVVSSDKKRLQYNSLRVYKKADCTGGWALEPHVCQGPLGDGECACSHVPSDAFRSIQVVLD